MPRPVPSAAAAALPPSEAALPSWSQVLRALREARRVSQEGWAAQLAVSRSTVQRWERGEAVPDPDVERALITYCSEHGLFRRFEHGSLEDRDLTPEMRRWR